VFHKLHPSDLRQLLKKDIEFLWPTTSLLSILFNQMIPPSDQYSVYPEIFQNPFNAQNDHTWNDDYVEHLPNPVAQIRKIIRVCNGMGPEVGAYASDHDLTTEAIPAGINNIPRVPLNADIPNRMSNRAALCPNLKHDNYFPVDQMKVLKKNPTFPVFPILPDHAAYNSELEIYRLLGDTQFMHQMCSLMVNRNKYFLNPTTFKAVRTGTSGVAKIDIIRSYQNDSVTAAITRYLHGYNHIRRRLS
jgi:hypothetical protein